VFQSNNIDEIITEIQNLMTEKHDYKTLIIDPITMVYNQVQEKWTRIFEKNAKTVKEAEVQDFGMRYWGKIKSNFKQLQRLLLAVDMNVIVTSHQKDQYGNGMQKIGVTFDSMKGEDYLYDFIFRLEEKGGKRIAVKIKERSLPDENIFPEEFEFTYKNFQTFYGKDILEKEVKIVELPTKEDIKTLNDLIETLNIPEDVTTVWLNKADVDSFAEMTKDQIDKCIKYCNDKIKKIKGSTKE
jgi:hypothetical protein